MSFPLTVGVFTCLMTIIWGGPLIDLLRRFRIGKQIRLRGAVSERHLGKEGTPTFGGVLIIVWAVLITLLINAVNVLKGTLQGRSILVPLAALVLFGALGAIDDWEGLRGLRAKGEGISARAKFAAQLAIAIAVSFVLFAYFDIHSVAIPSVPFKINLGYWYLPIAVFIIVAASNGTNLTDGLDGLAGNVTAVAFGAYGIVSFLQGQFWLATFDFIMVGCLCGFLWHNAHPAKIFMGDTGSQAVGATLGIVALMSGQWLLLPVIAVILVVETVSVILQTGYFWYSERVYGKRLKLFKMSPIHHHFELLGWSETQIVMRFWFVSLFSGLIGIALALL